MSTLNEKEAIQAYSKINKFDSHIIDGHDNDNIIKDASALKTIKDILKHKEKVRRRLLFLSNELRKRADEHDNSKLRNPEIEYLIEMDKEPKYPYNSPEYFDKMKRWQKFFDHHYANNRHHPDHFKNGILDMTLTDICEYLVDIISYYDEMHIHDAVDTIEKQQNRFGLDGQLSQILINTLIEYFSYIGDFKPDADKMFEDNKKENNETDEQ